MGGASRHTAGDDQYLVPTRRGHRRYLSEDILHKTPSSEDSQEETAEDWDQGRHQFHASNEDAQSYIGVSIGAEQTRLASPTTPAVEKAAFIGDDAFTKALQSNQYNDGGYDLNEGLHVKNDNNTPGVISLATNQRQTSLHPGPPPSHRPDGSITSVLRSVIGGRPRSSTGPSHDEPEWTIRKLLPISLPSLPSFPKLSSSNRAPGHPKESAISRILNINNSNAFDNQLQPQKRRNNVTFEPISSSSMTQDDSTRAPPIRRSTSDGSLILLRSKSYASSLGDDTRWAHIQEQVNVRAKAVKDSFADSSLRLPRFSLPNLPWHESDSSNKRTEHPLSSVTETRDFGRARSIAGDLVGRDRSRSQSRALHLGMTKQDATAHPQFSKALRRLTGDVVILGGYRGSILRSAEPPHRQLWVPIKVGLGVRKVHLEVGLEPEDDEKMKETIISSGMLKHIGPIDISRRLFKRLRHSENVQNGTLRVWDYGYDWRLSPEFLSRQLRKFLEGLPSNTGGQPNGVLVICHSLGGLITRHAINAALKSKQDLVSGVVYAGVPQTCVNILGPMRNGDDVLLSSKVLTAQVNFTIRTSYALLPLDGQCFFDRETKEEYPVDFFDPKTWEEYCLSPCCARPLPPNNTENHSMVDQLLNSMTSMLPSYTARRSTGTSTTSQNEELEKSTQLQSTAQKPLAPKIDQPPNPQEYSQSEEKTPGTTVTIKKEDAMRYLSRTLQEVKRFKEELAFDPSLEERYPPAAVIYGKSIPTVLGAGVNGREGIKCADAYDHLAFASGDGVVLAKAAQIPEGYRVVKGGAVSSDRGHISLLGDLEAVGTCINAIFSERKSRSKTQALANGKP